MVDTEMTTIPTIQPEAQRLSLLLATGWTRQKELTQAADELDRQHDEIARLTAENEAMRAELAKARTPLTDSEWLEYILRNGSKSDVHIATYEGVATTGTHGMVIRLQHDANNLRKLVEAAYGVHDAVADASTPSSAPRGGKFIPTAINMKLFKEGDKSKAICSFCKDVVSTTFKHRDVPFSDGIGVAKNILVSVCDCCGQVVATPPQSTPAIRLSRAKA